MSEANPIQSVWTRPRHQREQPALSRERIVEEAIRLLDADGIEALSMRTLGKSLNAGATSLYRHVANKDELIELVIDEVFGELTVPDLADPEQWRAAAAVCGDGIRAMAMRHPWVVSVLGQAGMAFLGPNLMDMSDRMMSILITAGFEPHEGNLALKTIIAYVIGWSVSEASWLGVIARSGLPEQEWVDGMMEQASAAVAGREDLFASMRGAPTRSAVQARDEAFTFGMESTLDGLQVRLDRER